jgi:hypothetical protein
MSDSTAALVFMRNDGTLVRGPSPLDAATVYGERMALRAVTRADPSLSSINALSSASTLSGLRSTSAPVRNGVARIKAEESVPPVRTATCARSVVVDDRPVELPPYV